MNYYLNIVKKIYGKIIDSNVTMKEKLLVLQESKLST